MKPMKKFIIERFNIVKKTTMHEYETIKYNISIMGVFYVVYDHVLGNAYSWDTRARFLGYGMMGVGSIYGVKWTYQTIKTFKDNKQKEWENRKGWEVVFDGQIVRCEPGRRYVELPSGQLITRGLKDNTWWGKLKFLIVNPKDSDYQIIFGGVAIKGSEIPNPNARPVGVKPIDLYNSQKNPPSLSVIKCAEEVSNKYHEKYDIPDAPKVSLVDGVWVLTSRPKPKKQPGGSEVWVSGDEDPDRTWVPADEVEIAPPPRSWGSSQVPVSPNKSIYENWIKNSSPPSVVRSSPPVVQASPPVVQSSWVQAPISGIISKDNQYIWGGPQKDNNYLWTITEPHGVKRNFIRSHKGFDNFFTKKLQGVSSVHYAEMHIQQFVSESPEKQISILKGMSSEGQQNLKNALGDYKRVPIVEQTLLRVNKTLADKLQGASLSGNFIDD